MRQTSHRTVSSTGNTAGTSGDDDVSRSSASWVSFPTRWELSPRPASIRDWQADSHKDWQAERMAVYAAQVEAIDRGLGELLETLQKAGEADNTLVMFLSDNGAAPDGGLAPTTGGFGFAPNAKNDRWRKDGVPIRPGSGPDNLPGPHDTFAAYGLAWANVSNTPLRGTKLTGYEGGIRTPLVVRWPAVIRQRGEFTDQVGHVIDIMATCLDVAGEEYPTEFHGRKPLPMEGKSLLPIFQGRQRKGHEVLCWSVPRASRDPHGAMEGSSSKRRWTVAALRSRSGRHRDSRPGRTSAGADEGTRGTVRGMAQTRGGAIVKSHLEIRLSDPCSGPLAERLMKEDDVC